jgi:uncharacterized protein YnzC (UPF0291/DUF896 family)
VFDTQAKQALLTHAEVLEQMHLRRVELKT